MSDFVALVYSSERTGSNPTLRKDRYLTLDLTLPVSSSALATAMLHCIYKRRKGLAKTAGFVGGVYLLQRYVTDRLDELKAKLDQEKLAREAYVVLSLSLLPLAALAR